LLDRPINTVDQARAATRDIYIKFKCPVLLKGGHLSGLRQALDFYNDGSTELLLQAPFINGVSTHGTGCTYSAAIAGYCAVGFPMPQSVSRAKAWITRAIAQSFLANNHFVLNHLQ